MTGVLMKRGNLDADTHTHTHTHTQGEHYRKSGVVWQKPQNTKNCQQATRSEDRGVEQPSQPSEETNSTDTLISDFQLQN